MASLVDEIARGGPIFSQGLEVAPIGSLDIGGGRLTDRCFVAIRRRRFGGASPDRGDPRSYQQRPPRRKPPLIPGMKSPAEVAQTRFAGGTTPGSGHAIELPVYPRVTRGVYPPGHDPASANLDADQEKHGPDRVHTPGSTLERLLSGCYNPSVCVPLPRSGGGSC